jgi:hypothetical protein
MYVYTGGEMKNITLTILLLTLILGAATVCFAQVSTGAAQSKTVDVRAEIPPLNALTVSITKIANTGALSANAGSVDFGTLSYDASLKRFKASCYYAVDTSVASNSTAYTLTHAVTNNVKNAAGTADLGCNINVSFLTWSPDLVTDSSATKPHPVALLGRYSLTDSNGKSFGSTTLLGQQLRILYEIATGVNDAPRVSPITADKPAGKYSGQVRITLVQ